MNIPSAITSNPFRPMPTYNFGHISIQISSECKHRLRKLVINQTAFNLNCGELLNGQIIPATAFGISKQCMNKKMPEIKILTGTNAKVSLIVRRTDSKMEIIRECQLRSFSSFCIFWYGMLLERLDSVRRYGVSVLRLTATLSV